MKLTQEDLKILDAIKDVTVKEAGLPVEYLKDKGIKVVEGQKYLKFLAVCALFDSGYNHANEFFDALFEAYHIFKYDDENIYKELLALNNPLINIISRRIEQLLTFSNTNLVIKEKQMHEVSGLLRYEIPNIIKKAQLEDKNNELLNKLKAIQFEYVFERTNKENPIYSKYDKNENKIIMYLGNIYDNRDSVNISQIYERELINIIKK